MENDQNIAIVDLPIACTLTAKELTIRQEDNGTLFTQVSRVTELADGYAFQFPGTEEQIAQLLRFINAERQCCPFFVFELAFEQQEGPIWLRIRGPEGVKAIVQQWASA